MKKKDGKWYRTSVKYLQVGCKIKITTNEVEKGTKRGLKKGTTHTICKPPKNKINSHMGVWVEDKKGVKRYLQFMNFITLHK